MPKKILIVDDDPHIREVVMFAMKRAGLQVCEANDGQQALELAKSFSPDLIILDINLPEKDGLTVCKDLRKNSDIPILFLSSRDDEVDRIVGLEIGGDDYVTKPFSPRELVARVNVILKRARNVTESGIAETNKLTHGLLVLEIETHQTHWNEKDINLTSTEFSILRGMLRNPNYVCNRDKIMDFAYDTNVYVSDRTIDSHIRHIRQKFSDVGCQTILNTVHGVGYKMGLCT